uniref:Uncharacterized protein n=1 Tax=Panagrolaimus superbus TaxID=310955 RepID=A0A914Y5Z3_9BILA
MQMREEECKYILDEIRKISVDKNSKPIADIVIMDCGLLNKNKNKEEGELTTSSSSNEVVIEKVTKRRRSSSVEILENENDIKKRRRLAAANMPKFCERENPLYRKSSEHPRNELFPERHDQQSDFGRRRRFREDDSPPRNQNHSKNKAEKRVKGRGTARYEPYSSSNIPTPSYWKAEKQRIIPMKDAKDLILRKQEETKALFSEMTDQTERKNLFPIYHPEHVEARKMLQKEAETAEKAAEQERYFGYENSYDNLGSGSSTTSSRFHHSNQETSTTPRYDLPYGFYPTPINFVK